MSNIFIIYSKKAEKKSRSLIRPLKSIFNHYLFGHLLFRKASVLLVAFRECAKQSIFIFRYCFFTGFEERYCFLQAGFGSFNFFVRLQFGFDLRLSPSFHYLFENVPVLIWFNLFNSGGWIASIIARTRPKIKRMTRN